MRHDRWHAHTMKIGAYVGAPVTEWQVYCTECDEAGRMLVPAAATGIDVERLAAVEHEQWIEWSQTIAREGLTPERIARWERYWVPYEELDETTKEHDRKWARIAIARLGEPQGD